MADDFKSCSIDGCNGNAHRVARGCRGYCNAHYKRLMRYGDPQGGHASRARGSLVERLWAKVKKHGPDDCWPWTGCKHSFGHGQIGRGRREDGVAYAHVVAWEISNGRAVPEGMIVRHSCDNPPCCNPNHLLIGTKKDNMQDMVSRKRHCYGENAPASVLTDAQALEIYKLRAAGVKQRVVADMFNICGSNVGRIARKEIWKHIHSD